MLKRLQSSTLREFVDPKTSAMLLRLFASFGIFYGHGYAKIMNVLSGNLQFLDPIGIGPEASLILAAFAEGICAIFIFIGYYTRLAALFLIINMSVVIFFVHIPADHSFGRIELPMLYLGLWIVIFLLGPGKYSIDDRRS